MKASLFPSAFSALAYFTALAATQSNQNCPLLGPVFPAPSRPNSSIAVQSVQKIFPGLLAEALSAGILDNTTTSFSINIFSASNNQSLFTYHFAAPGLNGSLPSGSLNDNTIYRIGSLSKLFTVYTLLAENGNVDFNQPVTKYIPELAAASTKYQINNVQWSDVTIAALASHQAGIARDYGVLDLANEKLDLAALGLTALNASEIPTCGFDPENLKPCDREGYINGLLSERPVTSPFHTAIYSNAGFVILGYVIESIVNQTFSEAISSAILEPLKMSRTLTQPPTNETNVIIPVDALSSAFSIDIGSEVPAGGIFSTLSDLRTLGLSLLHSTLLPASLTRWWMKPMVMTSNTLNAVGAPWEIFRQELPLSSATNNTRVVDLYTKGGDVGLYSSLLALDKDHNIGFSILTAGASSSATRTALGSIIAAEWVPALEAAAREEANATFAGTYISGDSTDNSTITITLEDGRPGLDVSQIISKSVDFRQSIRQLVFNVTDPSVDVSIRLYPTSLVCGNLISFRAIIESLPYTQSETEGVFNSLCQTWVEVDGNVYGSVGFDDFEFALDRSTGQAVEIRPRVLRDRLSRAA
ncbi:beta-lactamase/transpeptidase-like protein [Lepidopterella palustris CBS 459.81]|uniref:Beta-lactamase/transpeptidase-like protein n=1 Tax=Lepidopterella palustris CBS 459.81 TaxID=1314670 RepID=A0A8E2EKR9_9PEZI|nr:beta-lactamase/transpeptidase-like protein [Lepidopterella palustris CBS 459.81]